MKLPHDKFCVLPWISLETSPIGTVRPCCLAEDELVDNAGEKFNLNSASFSAIQNSHSMRKLRQQFIDGEQPKTCQKCWREERSGRISKRMNTLTRLNHILPAEDWTLDAKPLLFLDLKLGNICNLKCRICGSWSSSTFATEELQYVKDKKSSYHYQMLRQGAWPRENEVFWREIDQISSQIRYLEFTGGEPFMIQEHFSMLQALVERGIAKDIEIHYNTNGTQYPEYAENIWQHFKTVEIAFSIDDVSDRFEYQRTGANWNEVRQNIALFRQMRERNPCIQLQVCTTVNVFNVYYLEDVANWIDTQSFDFVYWNMLHEPSYLSIQHLSLDVKQFVTEKLKSITVSPANRLHIDTIIDYLNAGVTTDNVELCNKIRELDVRRQQDFSLVSPEMALLLKYEKS